MSSHRAARAPAAALAVSLVALVAPGCVSLVPKLPAAFSPCRDPEPPPPAAFGADFRTRVQVSLRKGGSERAALDAVIEKRGDRLVVVAFDRAGARLFSAVWQGDEVEVEPAPGRRRPVAPEALLSDLAWLRGAATPPAGVTIERDHSTSGLPRALVRDTTCGSEAVYVTVEERPPA